MAKVIKLTKGCEATVDDGDFSWLSEWKWFVNGSGYAVRSQYKELPRTVLMHRSILFHHGVEIPPGWYVDHINRNRLDNRLDNLRAVSPVESTWNRVETNKYGYRGVRYQPFARKGEKVYERGKPWRARITIDGRGICLGDYETVEEAARAYDSAAIVYHGPFVKLNFPSD